LNGSRAKDWVRACARFNDQWLTFRPLDKLSARKQGAAEKNDGDE